MQYGLIDQPGVWICVASSPSNHWWNSPAKTVSDTFAQYLPVIYDKTVAAYINIYIESIESIE